MGKFRILTLCVLGEKNCKALGLVHGLKCGKCWQAYAGRFMSPLEDGALQNTLYRGQLTNSWNWSVKFIAELFQY